ncbi:hypothetical protein Godav_021102 [Gossypium davidsonii]|uniref:Uncharacterized protein n=1 Tax=Gossypium davidsonii TaxID=34287 RepID=A0A7J8R545_GOSDV|nr:hypothetical protein [Gossypium davidsonii]
MLYIAFGPTPGPILFRRSSLKLSCDNMSLHKFKDYSMVKMDIDVRVANCLAWGRKYSNNNENVRGYSEKRR